MESRVFFGLMIILAASILAAEPGATSPSKATLEDTNTRLIVSSGRLVSLLDRVRSLEHVAADADSSSGLFRVQLVRGIRPVGEIDASQMSSRVKSRSDETVEIDFDHARVGAHVGISLGERPGETHWSISVRPKDAEVSVGHVEFPVIVTPRRADGSEKRYLFPMFEGRFRPLSRQPLWRPHPSYLFAQMIACVGNGGGFLLWTDDDQGHVKAFGYTNRGKVARFGVRHQMPYRPGKMWESSYRTRLTFCDGSWRDAAGIYRKWATAQQWSGTPLRDRQDVSDLLRHPPLCISTQLDKENLADLPDRLAAWGERFDVPIIYRPLGWEKYGNWVGIDYFPPSIGAEQFKDLAARLRERDIYICGFISGYRWTTHSKHFNKKRNRALATYFEKHKGPQVCERTRGGTLLPFKAEGRDSHRICRGTPFGRTFLPRTARSLFDLGVTIIHDDQDHGPYPGGVESCFDTSHGHPVPCGPWATQATRDSLQDIRTEAARRGLKKFFVTKESCTELLNMDLHAYQTRIFHKSTRPDLIPLSQYLYHEHIPVIFGWVTARSRSQWDLAAMLVYGQIPSLAFWNAPAERPNSIPAASRTLLADYFAAMATHAKPYLLYGQMQPPLVADVPSRRKEIRRIRGRELRRPRVIEVPLVIQSVWEDAGGKVGLFAANTQESPATLKVPAPGKGRWHATTYIGAQGQSETDLTESAELTWQLPPNRLCSVIFKPGK